MNYGHIGFPSLKILAEWWLQGKENIQICWCSYLISGIICTSFYIGCRFPNVKYESSVTEAELSVITTVTSRWQYVSLWVRAEPTPPLHSHIHRLSLLLTKNPISGQSVGISLWILQLPGIRNLGDSVSRTHKGDVHTSTPSHRADKHTLLPSSAAGSWPWSTWPGWDETSTALETLARRR